MRLMTSLWILSVTLVIGIVLVPTSAVKIILYASQVRSHVLEQMIVGEALASRGHQVYVALPNRYDGVEAVKKRGMHPLIYRMPSDTMYLGADEYDRLLADEIFNGTNQLKLFFIVSALINQDCTYMMEDDQFLSQVRQIGFDLAIIESFAVSSCPVVLPAYIGIPYVLLGSGVHPWYIRTPVLPSFHLMESLFKAQYDPSIMGRLNNLLSGLLTAYLKLPSLPSNKNTTLLRKYIPSAPSFDHLIRQSRLFLMTNGPRFGHFFPTLPNVIIVPGLNALPAKPLPPDVEKLVNAAEHGIILITFGATAKYIPVDIVGRFLKAFGQVKQTVLAKLPVPDGMTVPSNVKLMSWLPQNDILGHPKTKLFITHCGTGGQYESLYHGVPMIGMPMFADQEFNCNRAYVAGYGLEMNMKTFSADELVLNINEVITNQKYATAVKKASAVWRDEPVGSLEKAVFWVEHVIKFGGDHLRSVAFDMPLYQFLMIDLWAVLGCVILVVVCVMIFVCTKMCRAVGRKLLSKSDKVKIN